MPYTNGYFNTQADSSGNGVKLDYVGRQVYSNEMLFTAQPILRFAQVVTEKTELGTVPGQGINFTKYGALTGSSALTEGTAVAPTALSTSQIQITVSEFGLATSVSEKRLRTAFTDVMSDASQILGRSYAKDFDGRVRDELLTSGNSLICENRSTRAALTAGDTMNVDLIKTAVENLAINKAPKFNGDAYVCFVHPHQATGLRSDPEWISANHYGGAAARIFAGEIGRFEDVVFVETTQCPYVDTSGDIYADSADTGSDSGVYNDTINTYKAIICGDHCIGHAEALPPELRDNGVEDFGRQRSLMWYTIDGLGLIETGHVFILETA